MRKCDYNVCFACRNKSIFRQKGGLKEWGSVSGTLITILSDTHSHCCATVDAKQRAQLRTLKLHAGKIGPRGGREEGVAGTDVRLQGALEAPGVSMTLALVFVWKKDN